MPYWTVDEFVNGNPEWFLKETQDDRTMTSKMLDAVNDLVWSIPFYSQEGMPILVNYDPEEGFYLEDGPHLGFITNEEILDAIDDYKRNSTLSPVADKFWELFSTFEDIPFSDEYDEEISNAATDAYHELIDFVIDELNEKHDTLCDEFRKYVIDNKLTYDDYDPDSPYPFDWAFDDCLRAEDWDGVADLLDTYKDDFDLDADPNFHAYYAGVPLEDIFI